ncbi:DoxX family protein [Planococcus lenghuensis]|nr:DoxX family protein [Planococcus lenghuensis]
MNNKFDISLLILRIVLGVIFFLHGWVKFQDGIGNTVGWFESIGLPGVLAYGVAGLELVGGLLLVLGLFSRVVAGLLAVLMVGAILKVKLAVGFLGNGQMAGYELDFAFLAMAAVIAINGAGAYSLDQVIFKEKQVGTGKSFG